ncbi:hypothetical protein ACE3MZ_17080 [Paenibacillus sp. WLX1005]|uniref:hypothetical protein n=1 Tax=Paenibacillus sp. WLX1005 TaxID=3243766 RepID=UPI00398420F1
MMNQTSGNSNYERTAMLKQRNSQNNSHTYPDGHQYKCASSSRESRVHSSKIIYKQAAMIALIILLLTVWTAVPQTVSADQWSSALSGMDTLYDSVTALEKVLELQSDQIIALRKQNNASLKSVKQRIQTIDISRIQSLQTAVQQLESKHAPLLKQYKELGQQITAARKVKHTKTAELLTTQRNRMKAQVQTARTEISAKKSELSSARKQTAARKQTVRNLLEPVQVLKKQITAENKVISAAHKLRTSARKGYRSAVKRGDAITGAAQLTVVYRQMTIVQKSRQNIYDWEKQISRYIQTAESKVNSLT